MRIVIEASLLARKHSTEERGAMLSLFIAGQKGPHTVEVSPSDSPHFRRWVETFDEATQEIVRAALFRAVKEQGRRRRLAVHVADVTTASWAEVRLPLDVAVRVVGQPLTLLVENARNEPAFLRALTRLRRDFNFDALVASGAIEPRTNGGIDENRMWLEQYATRPSVAMRTWVLCDSDTRRPWRRPTGSAAPAELGTGARKLTECCQKHGVRLHVLARRFIESYLPLPAIQQWAAFHEPSRNPKFWSLSRLTAEQRHHYNMKEGFAQDKKDAGHAAKVGRLYDGVDQSDLDVLKKGIAKDIADLFHEKDFRIAEQWLRTDKQEEEVHEIVDAIMELI